MRGLRSFWAVGVMAAAVSFGVTAAAAAEVLAVRAARVVADAETGSIGPGVVLVKEGRIVSVTAGATPPAPPEGDTLRVIDLGDRTLLPGLIDSHVHLTSDPAEPFWRVAVESPELSTLRGAKNARLTVEAGFTTVRDLGAPPAAAQALRDAVARGFIVGPRILASGPPISIVGGHGDSGGPFNRTVAQAITGFGANTCSGAEACAARVRELSRDGADVIKFTATGGVLSQQNRGFGAHFTKEEMTAIVSTAHQLGLKVAAHAHGAEGVRWAAEAGVDSIEHGTFMDEAAAKALKAAGGYLSPTYMPAKQYLEATPGSYTPVVEAKIKERLAALGRNVRMAKKAGVPIAFGTDTGVSPHGRNGEEFQMLVQHAGLTPKETLVAATRTAAELLGLSAEIGTLAAGKSADLVAVEGDPFTDVRVMEKPVFVMARGKVVKGP